MKFKIFLENYDLFEDFFVITEKLDEKRVYPSENLSKHANKKLGLRVEDTKITVPVRQPRTDPYNQIVVQYIGHFMNRIQERDVDLPTVINMLKQFIDKKITKLAGTHSKSSHVEGIITTTLPNPVFDDNGREHTQLNIPYRYSTFRKASPKFHVLTFITAMVKDDFKQNAPPKHLDTIVKDFKF